MERRRTTRVKVMKPVVARTPATPRSMIMHDISASGCRIECSDTTPVVGSTLLIQIRTGIYIPGQVVWVDGSQAGIQFGIQLHGTLLDLLAMESSAAQPSAA